MYIYAINKYDENLKSFLFSISLTDEIESFDKNNMKALQFLHISVKYLAGPPSGGATVPD